MWEQKFQAEAASWHSHSRELGYLHQERGEQGAEGGSAKPRWLHIRCCQRLLRSNNSSISLSSVRDEIPKPECSQMRQPQPCGLSQHAWGRSAQRKSLRNCCQTTGKMQPTVSVVSEISVKSLASFLKFSFPVEAVAVMRMSPICSSHGLAHLARIYMYFYYGVSQW